MALADILNQLAAVGAAYYNASDAMAARRQNIAAQKQAMDYQAWQIEQARQAEIRRQSGIQGVGWALESPPVSQTPEPGQPSVPMTPPGVIGMPLPNAPRGGQIAPPQIPPYQTVDRGASQAPQFVGDQNAIVGELSRIKSPQDRQAAMAQYTAQLGQTRPPPVSAAPSSLEPKELTLNTVLERLREHNAPPDQIIATLEQLTPIFNMQGAETKQQLALLKAELSGQHQAVMEAQGWERVGQGQERVNAARERALIMASGKVSDATPEMLAADATQYRQGVPLAQISKGWGTKASDYAQKVKRQAISEMIAEGMSAREAGNRLAQAAIEYKAASGAYVGLEKISAGQEKIGEKLKLDIGNLKRLLPTGDANTVKIFNTPINKLRSAFSSETYAPFRLQAELVGNEFERQMVGNGLSIAQLPVAAQENAKKVMNGDMSVDEILSILPTMIKDMQNVAEANRRAKGRVMERFGATTPAGATTAAGTTGIPAGWSVKER